MTEHAWNPWKLTTIGLGLAAAGGAIVDGGSGPGRGAAIGGVLGAGSGALYGGCLRSRGYAS